MKTLTVKLLGIRFQNIILLYMDTDGPVKASVAELLITYPAELLITYPPIRNDVAMPTCP